MLLGQHFLSPSVLNEKNYLKKNMLLSLVVETLGWVTLFKKLFGDDKISKLAVRRPAIYTGWNCQYIT